MAEQPGFPDDDERLQHQHFQWRLLPKDFRRRPRCGAISTMGGTGLFGPPLSPIRINVSTRGRSGGNSAYSIPWQVASKDRNEGASQCRAYRHQLGELPLGRAVSKRAYRPL
jgi:hypothetical protein